MPSENSMYKIVGSWPDGAMQLEQGDQALVLGADSNNGNIQPPPYQCEPRLLGPDFDYSQFGIIHGEVVMVRELFGKLFGERAPFEAPHIQLDTPLPLDVIRLISQYLHLGRNNRHLSGPIPIVARDGVEHEVHVDKPTPLHGDGRVYRLRKVTGEVRGEQIKVIAQLRRRLAELREQAA